MKRYQIERPIYDTTVESRLREKMLEDLYQKIGETLEIGVRYTVLITMNDFDKSGVHYARYECEVAPL